MMRGWRGFVFVALAVFGTTVALLAAFVFLMTLTATCRPCCSANMPSRTSNQRFQYPALIRSGRFDSVVVGASDARLFASRRA